MRNSTIDHFLDTRNKDLWRYLISKREIKIKHVNSSVYSCYSKGNTSIITVPSKGQPSIPSFTHELLHAYIKTLGFSTGGLVSVFIKDNPTLNRVFSESLHDHISNTIDHIIMYPIFIEMGYQSEEFLVDFNNKKCDQNFINSLKYNYSKAEFINKSSADLFIGNCFTMLADPNKLIDYSLQKIELKQTDSELYECIKSYVNWWLDFDITDQNNYFRTTIITSEFCSKLENWSEGKSYISPLKFSLRNIF